MRRLDQQLVAGGLAGVATSRGEGLKGEGLRGAGASLGAAGLVAGGWEGLH